MKCASKYAFHDDLLNQITAHAGTSRRVMLQLPTAGGKTRIARRFAEFYANKLRKRVWFMVHRRELLRQTSDELAEFGLAHGILAAGEKPQPDARVQVCSVMSMARRWRELPAPDLIIWDEAHHCAAKSWRGILEAFPNAMHLGLSATPERLDGKPLGDLFQHLIVGPPPAELEARGVLAPCRIWAPSRPELGGVKIAHGEYDRAQAEEAIERSVLVGDVVAHYLWRAENRPALLFAISVKASKAYAERFRSAGVAAAHVDADTPAEERKVTLRGLEDGSIKVVCSVDVFTEGLNVPTLGAVILLRPTVSAALALQMIGRGRRHPDNSPWPDLVVLDNAGLVLDHGFPNDEREWSLTEKRKREAHKALRCRQCGELRPVGSPRACGCVAENVGGSERMIDEVMGNLVEISGPPEGCETMTAFAKRLGKSVPCIHGHLKSGLPVVGRFIHVERAMTWLADRKATNTTRQRERMQARHKDPQFVERMKELNSEWMKKLNANPDFAERQSKRMKANQSDPEFLKKSAMAKQTPESRARMSAIARAWHARKGHAVKGDPSHDL